MVPSRFQNETSAMPHMSARGQRGRLPIAMGTVAGHPGDIAVWTTGP
jgi:hypothetical protein